MLPNVWTPEEDAILLVEMEIHGRTPNGMRRVADIINRQKKYPHRTGSACISRVKNLKRMEKNHDN